MCNKDLVRKNVMNFYLGFCNTLQNVGFAFVGFDQVYLHWFIRWSHSLGDDEEVEEIAFDDDDMCLLLDPISAGQKRGWKTVERFELHMFYPDDFPVESLPDKLKPKPSQQGTRQ